MRLIFLFLSFSLLGTSFATSDFYSIKEISYLANPGKHGAGTWDWKGLGRADDVFLPCLEVKLVTSDTVRSEGLTMTAHFFDAAGKLAFTVAAPSRAQRDRSKNDRYSIPSIFPKGEAQDVYFTVPPSLLKSAWKAVIVFGDKNEAEAKQYPSVQLIEFNYPEKQFVSSPPKVRNAQKAILNPLIEEVVHTTNPLHPQITLFFRLPTGATDMSQVKGVLALCVLANSVEDIRRKLQTSNPEMFGGFIAFANTNKLAILCWGSQQLWDPHASFDDMTKRENEEIDRNFDQVADAWERGVHELQEKYNIPIKNYLLRGQCGAAQWAHRLALRKPDYFLAVALHIPSSFDKPTPDASKILWLLTTGERDGGYQRNCRFYNDCRTVGYPMIFKPIVGLGHSGSPIADDLAIRFFEYALSVEPKRAQLDETLATLKKAGKAPDPGPWLESFKTPPFYGDYLNQEQFPASRQNMIPAALKVPLPTKELASAWNK